jgi:hypothetical protein
MRRIAVREKVALIDLNAMSQPLYQAMGVEGSKRAFVHYPAGTFPNQKEELKDDTHFSNYGAFELARCVVEGIRTKVPDWQVTCARGCRCSIRPNRTRPRHSPR